MTTAGFSCKIVYISRKGCGYTPYYIYQSAISYADAGVDGRLTHGGLLRLLQEAASLASEQVGFGVKDVEKRRLAWMLTGWRVECKERPFWPAPITIRTWPRLMDGFFSERDYEVFSGDSLVALATSRWLLVNIDTSHAARITPEIKSLYSLDDRCVLDQPIATVGHSDPAAEETFSCIVGRRDIDTNHHVNNLHYLDYALEALPENVWEHLPPTVEILFRKQIRLGTEIHCFYTWKDGRHQVEIRSDQSRTPHAFLWFS